MAGPSNNNQVQPATSEVSQNKVDAYEVGWLFVQQYFTFLNSSPDRLHCFYSPSCQFVRGTQGEAAAACVGQKEIRERIKAYGYSDCKVNISDIDVQSSRGDIIIVHVIGELENKGVSQRFVQLFTLEENANNFSIINDILRFISSDSSAKASLTSSEVKSSPEAAPAKDAAPVEQAPEKVAKATPAKPSEAAKPVAAPVSESKDKDSAPPASTPAPSGPKTWANRVASQAEQKQSKAPSSTSTPVSKPSPSAGSPQSDTKPSSNTPKDNETALSHIQLRVKDNINKKALHEVLSVHGPIVQLDIVKGFAYVDFQNADSATKAIANGKITLGPETLLPELRQPNKPRYNVPSSNSQHNNNGSENRRSGGHGSQSRRSQGGAGDLPSPDKSNFEQKGGSQRRVNNSNGPRNNTRNNRPPAQEGSKQA